MAGFRLMRDGLLSLWLGFGAGILPFDCALGMMTGMGVILIHT